MQQSERQPRQLLVLEPHVGLLGRARFELGALLDERRLAFEAQRAALAQRSDMAPLAAESRKASFRNASVILLAGHTHTIELDCPDCVGSFHVRSLSFSAVPLMGTDFESRLRAHR